MWQNAHDSYLESRVLSADPIELIRMLYQSATRAVETARRHLAAGDIAARARSISHASAVVIELATSLDHERGGKISANLAQLYDYMLRRLTEANLQQSDSPLAEVLKLLATLTEAWEGVKAQGAAAPAPQERSAEPPASKPAARVVSSSQEPSSPESAPTYGSSWAQPASQESAASYGSSWEQPNAQGEVFTYGSSWEQPKPQEGAVTFPWEQAKSPDSGACSWEQPKSQESTATFESSEAPAPWPAAANSWSPDPSPWTPAAAVQELAAAYGYSWAQSPSQESAAAFGGVDSSASGPWSPPSNPWEPVSPEPAAPYETSWSHLVPQESAAGHSSHDWSL